MATCRECGGEGYRESLDDGERERGVRDACYHCATTGQVDEDTDWHDRLHAVASRLAEQEESAYRKACDEEPDGDGYVLHAAENGLSAGDYFRCRVWERADRIAVKLSEKQELLVAWNEAPHIPSAYREKKVSHPVTPKVAVSSSSDDDIPF